VTAPWDTGTRRYTDMTDEHHEDAKLACGEDECTRTDALMAKAEAAVGESIGTTAGLQAVQGSREAWQAARAAKPKYRAETLLALVEGSSILRPAIDAMVAGVHGFGFRLRPVVDLDAEDLEERVKAHMEAERVADYEFAVAEAGDDEQAIADADTAATEPVTDAEIRERVEDLRAAIPFQQLRARLWFEQACQEMPFDELRRRAAWDREAIGHGAWEVGRDSTGGLRRLAYLPGHTVQPVADDQDCAVLVDVPWRVSPVATRQVAVYRTFQRYVQIQGRAKVYFKELGDPRLVSDRTGAVYADKTTDSGRVVTSAADLMAAKEPKANPAREILFFPIPWPNAPAGVPRWVGNLPAVMGQREAEELTWYYFQNKSVPVGAWVVTNGTLADGVKEQIQEATKTRLKGIEGFHRALVIEVKAPPSRGTERNPTPAVQWIDLMGANKDDTGWTKYDKANRDKIGSAFRLPPLLRGEAPSDLTRANSYASLEFADQQVFAPERKAFDWIMNQRILPELGCDLVEFVSGSPTTTDAAALADAADVFAKHGGLVPDDVRRVAAEALGMDLDPLTEEWARQPLALTTAGILPGSAPDGEDPEEMVRVRMSWLAAAVEQVIGQKLERIAGIHDLVYDGDTGAVEVTPGVHLPEDGPA